MNRTWLLDSLAWPDHYGIDSKVYNGQTAIFSYQLRKKQRSDYARLATGQTTSDYLNSAHYNKT